MKRSIWFVASLIILASLSLTTLHASAQSAGPFDPPDPLDNPHSTTGPRPPRSAALSAGYNPTAHAVTLTVPALLWTDGCGPTAAGMVLDYWSQKGFHQLFPNGISEGIASSTGAQNHHADYALPLDDATPDLLDDCSSAPGCVPHADNSLADFMLTSRRQYGLRYGWTYFFSVGSALDGYVGYINASQGAHYRSTTSTYSMSQSNLWALFTAEIRAGRPVIFLVDSNADGAADHFATVTGFDVDAKGKKWYRLNNTWDVSQNHWFAFLPVGAQIPWGVYGMTTFALADDSNQVFIPIVRR